MSAEAKEIKTAILEGDDFGHEMRVGGIFSAAQLQGQNCYRGALLTLDHGGTYIDSITKKPRQFDYRCNFIHYEHTPQNVWRVLLAVECKNLYADCPLVISGRPRTKLEAYHVLLQKVPNEELRSIRVEIPNEFYPAHSFVGKGLLRYQPARGNQLARVASDQEIYDKWAQSISSCAELAESACYPPPEQSKFSFMSAILPIVVIPNGTLWTVCYANDGTMRGLPEQVDQCEYFIDRKYTLNEKPFALTHVHFMTLQGLTEFLSHLVRQPVLWDKIFRGYKTEMF